MKIYVCLKDPDTMQDAVDDEMKRVPRPDGISKSEWAVVLDERADAIKSAITDAFMRYGEYLDVVFDVDDETLNVTATVEPAKD